MTAVLTAGELLAEIMRPDDGVPLADTGTFLGPYPSGAPAIFADAVARLGWESGIVGAVGEDAFGRRIVERLERDGVDTTAVRTVDDRATGVAFVAYRADGTREFLFHLGTAAAGAVGPADVSPSTAARADAVHVTGSSLLATDGLRAACEAMVEAATHADRLVSFDPNVRPELLGGADRDAVDAVLESADLVTPTRQELGVLVGDDALGEAAGARKLLERGPDLVAVTKGADGCTLYTDAGSVHHEGFDVEAVDPTGGGDAFAAAMVVGALEGTALDDRAAFANAVGALAVTAQGPMEGLPERAAVDDVLE